MVADAGRSVSFLEIKYDEAGNGYLRRIGWETDRHWATIRDIAFHPGGRLAVTVGDDAQAWLWDAQAGKALVRLGTHPGEIVWAAFDRTGDHVYTGGAETWIRRWDTRTSADDPDALLAAIYRWLPELSPDASAAPGPPAMEIRPYPKPRPSPARRTSAAP